MSQVWDIPCPTHTQKLVFIALADNSNDQRVCWPSLDYLARKCDLSRQAVITQIDKLIARGLLKVRKNDGRVNVYELLPDQSTALTRQPHLPVNAVDGSRALTPPVNPVDPHPSTALTPPVNGVDPNRKEPSVEPSVNRQPRAFVKPTLEQLVTYALTRELTKEDGEACYDHYVSNGWKVGKNPMRDWEAAVRNWKRQRPQYSATGKPAGKNGADTIVLQKEFDRAVERMKTIRSSYEAHQSWDAKDTAEFNKLKARRDELKKLLGVTV